jgi:hypothetical protein
MRHRWRAALAASILAGYSVLTLSAADPGVTLIGRGLVPGDALDLSGLNGQLICQLDNPATCIDQATFGGFGSGIAFTGHDNVFLAVPDRGPFDGRTDVSYRDRFHFLYMSVNPAAPFPNITTVLLDTRFLENESGQSLTGDAYAFDDDPRASLRFDPEGVSISRDGNFFVSDEYGPSIFKFDRQGHLVRRIAVPEKFLIDNPGGDVDSAGNSLELYPSNNVAGRQANRGMEGLAITPDGRLLVGIMQNALLQDNGLNTATPPGRVGRTSRLLTINLETGETHEYVYVLDAINQGRGVNELLAVNDHEFLVLERDNRTRVPTPPNDSQAPNLKRIYKIDLKQSGLTDVSDEESLPATPAELGSIVPFTKTLFIDLLDPSYLVDATLTIKDVIAEKVEALAWGPNLPDGRHVLYVLTDNDLFPGLPTQIYAFAIDGSASGANIKYEAQRIPGPLFPPGQVKKIVTRQAP